MPQESLECGREPVVEVMAHSSLGTVSERWTRQGEVDPARRGGPGKERWARQGEVGPTRTSRYMDHQSSLQYGHQGSPVGGPVAGWTSAWVDQFEVQRRV